MPTRLLVLSTIALLALVAAPRLAEAQPRTFSVPQNRILLDDRFATAPGQFVLDRAKRKVLRERGIRGVPEVTTPEPLSLPLFFERNEGQGPERALFVTRGTRYAGALMPDGLAIAVFRHRADAAEEADTAALRPVDRLPLPDLRRPVRPGIPATVLRDRQRTPPATERRVARGNRLVLRPLGANTAKPVGEDPLRSPIRQYRGNDKRNWLTGIPAFGRVRYERLYRGVDMVVHGAGGHLQYSFFVGRDGRAEDIRIEVDGAERLELDENGNLVMHTSGGPIVQAAPSFAEETGSKPRRLDGGFILLSANSYGFKVAGRTPGSSLVIDPEIVSSSYFGGAGQEGMLGTETGATAFINRGFDVAFGSATDAYVVGMTTSPDFPVTGDAEIDGSADVFALRLRAEASSDGLSVNLVYATYLGGSSTERGRGIAPAPDGSAYITGHSSSSDFPTSDGAIHPSPAGAGGYVAKLDPTGAFAAGTFVGSGRDHHPNALVFVPDDDGDGSLLVAGSARSGSTANDTTSGAFQTAHAGGPFDGFVARIEADLTAYRYFTFLGGGGRDVIMDVEQRDGHAYVVGDTTSVDLPVTAFAHQTTHSMADDPDTDCTANDEATIRACSDTFVARFGPDGEQIAFSTFLGDEREEFARGIAVTDGGQPILTGAVRTVGEEDATIFVRRLESGGGALIYDVAIPGLGSDHGEEIAIDAHGRAHVTGTLSLGGQTSGQGAQQFHGGNSDIFYARITAAGTMDYLTYIGGSARDQGFAVAAAGNPEGTFCALVAGSTVSTDIEVTNELQSEPASAQADLLMTLICDVEAQPVVVKNAVDQTVMEGEPVIFTLTVVNPSDTPLPAVLTDEVPAQLAVTSVVGAGCSRLGNSIRCDDGFVAQPGATTVTVTAVTSSCDFTATNSVTLQAAGFVQTDSASVTVSCRPPMCGDGNLDPDEECDWGIPGSSACRQNCTLAMCGDAVLDTFTGEECDDGNTDETDACNSLCLATTGSCIGRPDQCLGDQVCGKSCTFFDEALCIGVPTPGGGCIGLPVGGGPEQICDATASCMPASAASEIFN